jgi:NAD(P)H-flavin reductase
MVYLDKKFFLKGLESYNKSYVFALLDENKSILSATDYFEKPFSLKNNVLTIKGYKGNVVSYLKENEVDFDYYYACGPQVMLKYLALYNSNGCVSLEARMGCGFGACMGCSIETTKGPKRVCKEGPVFNASEVIF